MVRTAGTSAAVATHIDASSGLSQRCRVTTAPDYEVGLTSTAWDSFLHFVSLQIEMGAWNGWNFGGFAWITVLPWLRIEVGLNRAAVGPLKFSGVSCVAVTRRASWFSFDYSQWPPSSFRRREGGRSWGFEEAGGGAFTLTRDCEALLCNQQARRAQPPTSWAAPRLLRARFALSGGI